MLDSELISVYSPLAKKPGRPSKTDQKARTDPIPDDQDNIATSQFLQPVTPPRKAGKKDIGW
jgi:hypothetical protein